LRLNIFTPAAQQSRPLPVLVWIHGGGFVFGDGGWEFDGNHLVQHAVESGKPMVFVTLNYRLGYFGFLTSKELKEEAAKDGQKPFSNMAFYDQRLALLWVSNKQRWLCRREQNRGSKC
jgi:carboxylesterase type B